MDAYGTLARRKLEFRVVGSLFRSAFDYRKAVFGQIHRKAACLFQAPVCAFVYSFRMGYIRLYGYDADGRLLYAAVYV